MTPIFLSSMAPSSLFIGGTLAAGCLRSSRGKRPHSTVLPARPSWWLFRHGQRQAAPPLRVGAHVGLGIGGRSAQPGHSIGRHRGFVAFRLLERAHHQPRRSRFRQRCRGLAAIVMWHPN